MKLRPRTIECIRTALLHIIDDIDESRNELPESNPFGAIPEQPPVAQPTPHNTVVYQSPVFRDGVPLPDLQIPRIAPLTGDVDDAGVVWNSEIHSSSRLKTDKGLWRARRGLKERAAPAAGQPVAAPIQNVTPISAPVVSHVAAAIPNPVSAPLPVQSMPSPLAPSAHVTPPVSVRICTIGGNHEYTKDFFINQLVPILSQLMSERKIDQPYIESLKSYFKVKEIWEVLSNPEQQTTLYNSFCEHGLIKRVE